MKKILCIEILKQLMYLLKMMFLKLEILDLQNKSIIWLLLFWEHLYIWFKQINYQRIYVE